MKHEGCLRQHVLKWGQFIDLEMYAILRSEYAHKKSVRED
jgi:RimJ/RimL family protein N-acetyltransferase